MKIQLIAEGSTKQERKTLRWGISFLISDVLFDTFGRADIFWKNVRRHKIGLSRVKHIVISHEDWDHIAGLESFLKKYSGTRVYICKKTGRPLKTLVHKTGGTLIEIDRSRKISRNIFSLGQMRANTGRGVLYEQALVVKSQNGFSIVTGCAHPGVVRIVRCAVKLFGKKIYAVCGGFHMKDKTLEENEKIIRQLQALGIQKVIPLHCAGRNASRLFRKIYQKKFTALRPGQTLSV